MKTASVADRRERHLKQERHFTDLNTPWFNICACHHCYIQRRTKRVADKLKGIAPNTDPFAAYQFTFTGWNEWKRLSKEVLFRFDQPAALVPTKQRRSVLSERDLYAIAEAHAIQRPRNLP